MKKGNASLYIIITILSFVLIFVFVFATAINSVLLARLMQGADRILKNANPSIASISNSEVRNAVNASINSGKAAGVDTYEINSIMYRFGWVFIIIILIVVIYILAGFENNIDIRGLI